MIRYIVYIKHNFHNITDVSAFFLIRSANSALVSKLDLMVVEFVFVDLRCLLALLSLLFFTDGELILQFFIHLFVDQL